MEEDPSATNPLRDVFTAVGLADPSVTPAFVLVPDDNLKLDNPDVVHVCIGTVNNAFEAALQAFRGEEPKTWSAETRILSRGTVIAQDVDMLLPVQPGMWKAGLLTTKRSGDSVPCGCIYWHAELVGPGPSDAASLIRQMENTGASGHGANIEDQATLDLGVRFIGRYAWDNYRGLPDECKNHPAAEMFDYQSDEPRVGGLFGGPTCFFVQPNAFLQKVLPELAERINAIKISYNLKENEYFDYSCTGLQLPGGLSKITGNGGAVCVLPDQEYMFGRVFFSDQQRQVARAFMYFTYAMHFESFGLVSVGHAPVCPLPEKLSCCVDLVDKLREVDDETLRYFWTEWTPALRQHVLSEVFARPSPGIFERLVQHCLESRDCTRELFTGIPYRPSEVDQMLRLLIEKTRTTGAMQDIVREERQRFQLLQEHLVQITAEQQSQDDDSSKRSSRIFHLMIPGLFGTLQRRSDALLRLLLEAGAATDHVLARSADLYETPLMSAAIDGHVNRIDLLLEFGADPYETVAPLNWPAVACAAWYLQEATLGRLLDVTGELCTRNDYFVDLNAIKVCLKLLRPVSSTLLPRIADQTRGTLVDIALLGMVACLTEGSDGGQEAQLKCQNCVKLLHSKGVKMSPNFAEILQRSYSSRGEKPNDLLRGSQEKLILNACRRIGLKLADSRRD